ncbi:MAG: mechanosensitive ion channel family protein [Ferrimicrobium sp.]
MSIDELKAWVTSSGLPILLFALGSIILARFVNWLARHIEARVRDASTYHAFDDIERREHSKYLQAMIQGLSWAARALIYFLASVLILLRFGFPFASLLAPATVIGVALGFGAQTIVGDILSGFFIFAERQYGVGDQIRISQPGSLTGVSGTVEELTLRVTKIRSINGELISIPNGQILQVANSSKDWSQVVIDLQLPIEKNTVRAQELLQEVCETFTTDTTWAPLLLSAPRVTGVESISVAYVQLRVLAKTLPARQWEVARELRTRLLAELAREGLLPDSSNANVIQQIAP